jgi:hypothetical protein
VGEEGVRMFYSYLYVERSKSISNADFAIYLGQRFGDHRGRVIQILTDRSEITGAVVEYHECVDERRERADKAAGK